MSVAAPAAADEQKIAIPEMVHGQTRTVTTLDLATIRKVDTLSVSPDGRSYALFVRQAVPSENRFKTAWYIGHVGKRGLTYVADGGELAPEILADGTIGGVAEGSESKWSPDGKWIAYLRRSNGEIQLWRSNAEGTKSEQLSRDAADVREFDWNKAGDAIFYRVGIPRADLEAAARRKYNEGFQYDTDISSLADFLQPSMQAAPASTSTLKMVAIRGLVVRAPVSEEEYSSSRLGESLKTSSLGARNQERRIFLSSRSDGAAVWLSVSKLAPSKATVSFAVDSSETNIVRCAFESCTGAIRQVWWTDDQSSAFFIKVTNASSTPDTAFSVWDVKRNRVTTLSERHDDVFSNCAKSLGDRIICVREALTTPPEIVSVNMMNGSVNLEANLNPEFNRIALAKFERFSWATPRLSWNEPGGRLAGLYHNRGFGYILYPPTFDARKKYPVFVSSYIARGFDHPARWEQPLLAYAASGMVVLSLAYPERSQELTTKLAGSLREEEYSPELDYPHMSMLMGSDLKALDAVISRGFIDSTRVGMGGISHGTFIPLFMLQKYDRITALSISSSNWGYYSYYLENRRVRKQWAALYPGSEYKDVPSPDTDTGRSYWRGIDTADHIDEIEAPILMNLIADESFINARLIRNLDDHGRAYDAFVYAHEPHIKWQPAHIFSIMNRNLDWFRFWLQDLEDPDPTKADQYARWRDLRKLQCRNMRSIRDYCHVESTQVPIAR